MEQVKISKLGLDVIVKYDNVNIEVENYGYLPEKLKFNIGQVINYIKMAESRDQLEFLLTNLTIS